MSTPQVFEIRRPYVASNSGAGREDAEYGAIKGGQRLEHIKRGDDEAMLYGYRSVRHVGTRRYGVVVYLGREHIVHSFRLIEDAQVAYAQAERRVLGLGEARDVAAQQGDGVGGVGGAPGDADR